MSKELNGIKDNATVTDKSENLFINNYITNIKNKDTLILKSSLYIPKYLVSKKMLEKLQYKFNRVVYPKQCNANCENYDNRSLENCSRVCNILKIRMLKTKGKYYSIPYFSNKTLEQTGVSKLIKKYKVYDKRNDKKFNIDLQMNITLREYQKKIINIMKSTGYGQLESPARSGKCVTGNTLINTNEGVMYIKELSFDKGYNDYTNNIAGLNGNNLVSNSYKEYNSDVYKIVTKMNRELKATPEHPVYVKKGKKYEWVKIKDLKIGDKIVTAYANPNPIYPNTDNISKEYATYLGYRYGLKATKKYYIKDNYIIKRLKNICDILNKEYILENNILHFKDIWDNFVFPYDVRTSGKEVFYSFLLAFFECATSVYKNKVIIHGRKKEFMKILHTVLLTHFGITGKLYYYNKNIYISIYGTDIAKFYKTFPTSYVARNHKKIKMYSKITSYEEVTEILKLKTKETVYDVTVPVYHEFYANGIVSHNTVMFITLLQKLKRKTLILVHTKDIVTQTIDKIYKFTNIKDIEKLDNKKYIGSFDDYKSEDYAIIVDTYQKFYNDKNGKKRIKLLNKKYGISTLIIDECHLASAPSFAKVVNNINARYKFGVSATTDRIDGMQYIAKNIIGKVQAKSEDFGMLCNCTAVDSKVSLPNNIRPNSSFFVLQKFFSYSNKRIEVLCEQIKKYVDNERKILVPVIHIPAMKKIQKTLKDKYNINAELFYAKIKDRDTFLQKTNKGEYPVVLGMRKMVTLALDILAWDTIIEYIPLHNIYNYYQEISRVRTPYENKPTPIICTIVDDIAFSYKSFLKQDKVHKKLGFKFTKDYTKILEKYKKADRIKQTKYLRNEDLLPVNINKNEDDEYEDFNNVNTKYKENNYRAF